MKLICVHGRGQERTQSELELAWSAALDRGFANAGVSTPEDLEISLPFYWDRLSAFVTRSAVDRAAKAANGDVGLHSAYEFKVRLLSELASGVGLTDDDIRAELRPQDKRRGIQHWEWFQAIVRALSNKVPWVASMGIERFTEDVHIYLTKHAVRKAVHEILSREIPDAPFVLFAHSLGSIVGYWLLTELAETVKVPLFVTAGSPLGVEAIKEKLPQPLGRPKGVDRWLNATDERDPVALHSRLNRDVFPADIDNVSDVRNPRDDPHRVTGYLADERVARRLHAALTGNAA